MSTVNFDFRREWELENFLTFVLLFVASSDLSIDEEEISEMENAVKKYTKVVEFRPVYDEVFEVFKILGSEERADFIKSNKGSFIKDDEDLDMILTCIEEVIMADLSVEDEEAHAYTTLKRMLRS